jgi:hypothetical protein
VWIVDDDPLVRKAVAEDLGDRALAAVVMDEAHFRRELNAGQRPDRLLTGGISHHGRHTLRGGR